MVGDDALVDYPHPRHACAVFKFAETTHATHCPNCWCVRAHGCRHRVFFSLQRLLGTHSCATRLTSSRALSPFSPRCYCCDKKAPCPDWATHCDAKSGVARWDQMRHRIQLVRVAVRPSVPPSSPLAGVVSRTRPLNPSTSAIDPLSQAAARAPAGATAGAGAGPGAPAPRPGFPPAPRPLWREPLLDAAEARAAALLLDAAEERASAATAYLTQRPPETQPMPDPSTLPSLKLLGTLNIPMVLANGKTARDVDDKLAMYRHGIRFRDRYTMNTFDEERTSQAKNKPLNLYNLFTKTSDKKVATLGHMFRPGEPPAREMVPLRVIVIDCSGERAPVDVAIDVRRARDVAADVVDAIRKKCGVSDAEKVILAACEYLSPEARKPDDTTRLERGDGRVRNGSSKVVAMYTSYAKDGDASARRTRTDAAPADGAAFRDAARRERFENTPVHYVRGFLREYPDDDIYPNSAESLSSSLSTSRSCIAKRFHDPKRGKIMDALVAYRLPADASDEVVIVYPAVHDDFDKVKKDAQEAKKRKVDAKKKIKEKAQKRKDDMSAQRRKIFERAGMAYYSESEDEFYESDHGEDDDFDRVFGLREHSENEEKAANLVIAKETVYTALRACSVPLIVPYYADLFASAPAAPRKATAKMAPPEFLASHQYAGAKPGYTYKHHEPRGRGYYRDDIAAALEAAALAALPKVGGDKAASAISKLVKKILSRGCVVSGGDGVALVTSPPSGSASGGGKPKAGTKRKSSSGGGGFESAAAETRDDGDLPDPVLMHACFDYNSPFQNVDCETLLDIKEGKPHEDSYAKWPRSRKSGGYTYGNSAFVDSGFTTHAVTAAFDFGALSEAAKSAFSRVNGIIPGGAVTDPSAAEDTKNLAALYKAQHAEQLAELRSEKILTELKRAQQTMYEETNSGGVRYGPGGAAAKKWRLTQPLARLTLAVKSDDDRRAGSSATLEVKIYVKDPEAEPTPEDHRAFSCRSFVSSSQNACDLSTMFCNERSSSYSRYGGVSPDGASGAVMYESLVAMLWNDDMARRQERLCARGSRERGFENPLDPGLHAAPRDERDRPGHAAARVDRGAAAVPAPVAATACASSRLRRGGCATCCGRGFRR